MDQTQLQQQIALYYSKLTPDMQAMFSSMKWMDALREISRKYNLNEEQIQTIGTETTLVLLGIIDMEEYDRMIQGEISIPSESMVKMLGEIDSMILKSIRPQLTDAFEKNTTDLVEAKYGSVKELDERFSKLPKEVQTAISESNYQATLYKIAEKYKLSIDQMSSLDEVTTKVMIGIIHPDKYEVELQKEIAVPKDKIGELVGDVNEGVFKSVREALKAHWGSGSNKGDTSFDDEVPKPPYKEEPTTKPIVNIPKIESNIYKDAEIEVIDDTNKEPTPIKEEIQTPVPKTGVDMLADKLSGLTMSGTSVSDRSVPKVSPPPQNIPTAPQDTQTKKYDPYHEPIN